MKNRQEHSPSHPQDEDEAKVKKGMDRRKFLKLLGGTMGAAVVGVPTALVSGNEYVKHEARERSKELLDVYAFLRGESNETMEVFGSKLTYEQFCNLIKELSEPRIESQNELACMLDSFTYMMEVEDKFAGPLNVIPLLEDLEFLREKHFQGVLDRFGVDKETMLLSNTFGYGQIHPNTASMTALDKRARFLENGLLTEDEIEQLESGDLAFYETSDILELRAGGNLVMSFLSFYDGMNLYSRSTGGPVHGGLSFPDTRGRLQPRRDQNPRGFTLGVSAYSAGVDAPMVAKAQTYFNEMMIIDPDFQIMFPDTELLSIDGDIGDHTYDLWKEVADQLGLELPKDIRLKPNTTEEQERHLIALDRWLEQLRDVWKARTKDALENPENLDTGALRSLVQHRYSLQIKHYMLLKEFIPEDKAKQMLMDFMDRREGPFLDMIDNPVVFEQVTGSSNHDTHLNNLRTSLASRVGFDERYKGYIPTYFKLAKQPGADPHNMPARLLLAFDCDPNSHSKIFE